ncbi:MAG: dihydroorotase [Thiohalomonadaceae bacterium]
MNILIQGGRVIDPANGVDTQADVYVSGGRVAAVGEAPADFRAERVVDARGRIVCPGLVDLHARLREPGLEHKGTVASETRAAARAGITTLCFPPDTDPVVDTPAAAQLIKRLAREAGQARVLPLGALTQGLKGEQLAEMAALHDAGCIALGNARRPITNTLVMRRALEYAATLDLTVFLYPEDPWLAGGCVHEGVVGARLGLSGIPECAEVIGLARDLRLVEQSGVRAHFCQLSTASAVELVAEARARGLPVSADVAAHQLYLTEMDVGSFNSLCHVRPPLRTQRAREALRAGLASGAISAVCSDHQPHDADAKLAPFPATEPGASTLETLLPLMLRLADEGVLGLDAAIAKVTCEPAHILGHDSGTLAVGAAADVCVFDPERWWTVSEHTLTSRGKNSPFLGWELKGSVTHTLLAGEVVFELND